MALVGKRVRLPTVRGSSEHPRRGVRSRRLGFSVRPLRRRAVTGASSRSCSFAAQPATRCFRFAWNGSCSVIPDPQTTAEGAQRRNRTTSNNRRACVPFVEGYCGCGCSAATSTLAASKSIRPMVGS
jgi:hypothetical protein